MSYREYDSSRDLAAIKQIWKECGWIDDDEEGELIKPFFADGDAIVATIDDVPECSVLGTAGTICYQDDELELGAVAAVTTSHLARQSGFAKKLTARMLARQADAGYAVSALGMFDQGFYDKVGFGTGCYETLTTFDPTTLNIQQSFRPPKRLSTRDYKAIHQAMLNRRMNHGAVCLNPESTIEAELKWQEKPFGMGYFDGPGGSLSHFIFGEMKGENGPYRINWRAYQTTEQLMELLALIKSLGDQVSVISTLEFSEFQLQDLLDKPFRNRRSSRLGQFVQESKAIAYWQLRILDLQLCINAMSVDLPVSFNLTLSDPVTEHLAATEALSTGNWTGIGGEYAIHLSESSFVEDGHQQGLPELKASVNALSRLWLGVAPATNLAITDEITGDQRLLQQLDRSINLPRPHLGWDF